MIICFECPRNTKSTMDGMISKGGYKDYAEIIINAVDNLEVLKNGLSAGGAIVIGDSVPGKAGSSLPALSVDSGKIPHIFTLAALPTDAPEFAPYQDDRYPRGKDVPLGEWTFGHYNKILPLKAACRMLARLTKDTPGGIPVKDAAEKIANEAVALGAALKTYDKRNKTKRDDRLFTAFPEDTEKSRSRFANQIVGSFDGKGDIHGFLNAYKLINQVEKGRNPRIMLTEAGWKFAQMSNPILDNGKETAENRLSQEEIDYLLAHIEKNVYVEDYVQKAILSAIESGADTPAKLDALSKGKYPDKGREKPYTDDYLATQRAGAISRMADLGLVTRRRDGIHVSYVKHRTSYETDKGCANGNRTY